MQIAILALDGVFDTGLTVLLDTLTTANQLATQTGDSPPFQIRTLGITGQIRTGLGLTMAVEPVTDTPLKKPDWIVVPALNAKLPELLLPALSRPDVVTALDHLRRWHDQGIPLASACIGTFVLAESGVLDGHTATTTWSLAPLFRQRYPAVDLDETRMIAASDRLVTAGAAMGHLDLALWLMRRQSPELATRVARLLLIDRRPSQARYIMPDFLAHADPLIARFERWTRENLAAGFSLSAAAAALAVTPRTLQRRTEAVLGKSPLAFVQDLRVEHARHLITLGLGLEDIAAQVGYADGATLRSLLRRRLGQGVRDLRPGA